jgi:hypothetical protein
MVGAYMLYILDAPDRFAEVLLTGTYAAVYTSVLGPYVQWVLRKLRSLLGIGTTHRLRVR